MLEITSAGALEPTLVKGDFGAFVSDLNIAAASGKQFVIALEERDGITLIRGQSSKPSAATAKAV